MCGLAIAATIRGVISADRRAELAVHARHDEVETGEQLVLLVERSVLEDVHLDAGEDPERRELGVDLGDEVQLGAQPVR